MTGFKVALGAVVLVLVVGTPVDCRGQELRLKTESVIVGGVARVKGEGENKLVEFELAGESGYTATGDIKNSVSTQRVQLSSNKLTVNKADFNRVLTLVYKLESTGKEEVHGSLDFYVDSAGPILKHPSVDIYPSGAVDITLEFADGDVDSQTAVRENFRLYENLTVESEDAAKDPSSRQRKIVLDSEPQLLRQNRFVKLSYPRLAPGSYSLTVTGLNDRTKNTITSASQSGKQTLSITIPSGNLRGQQPEYPRFLAAGDRPSELNPGDRVDTRVVQLYYLRDARQVAELINRNIQDLNAFSYDAAQRAAADARKRAEDAIDSRRLQDDRAVEAARRTRDAEMRLEAARDELREVQRDQALLKQKKAEIENAVILLTKANVETLGTSVATAQKKVTDIQSNINTIENRLAENRTKLAAETNTTTITELKSQIAADETNLENENKNLNAAINEARTLRTLQGQHEAATAAEGTLRERAEALEAEIRPGSLPSQITQRQETEIAERQKVTEAEATELRASQEQFRREVAAGLADRNSYARGKLDSIDPVAQVSISVVGTSRLQLRGPIKGLNKICRMIHQLDSPVGQVKIGIHTIQVNGEHGDRMDVVYERINREVAHSRFLVNASGQLLRRAVQEVADEVAIEADAGILPPNCPPELQVGVVRLNGSIQTSQEQRDRRYLYAFYGSDFIGELEEMDSELLNTDNKLLSLHSMDTISLPGAMFVLAHADHPVRHRVLMRFQELIAGDLPLREMEFIRSLTQLDSCGKPLKYNPKRAQKIDDREARAIMFNNGRTYTFPNTVGFFSNQIQSQGTLNPVQYATVKLAQALKAQLVAEMEYRNLVVERTLLKEEETADLDKYNNARTQRNSQLRRQAELEAEVSNQLASALDAINEVFGPDANTAATEKLRGLIRTKDRFELADQVFKAVEKHQFNDDFKELVAEDLASYLDADIGARAYIRTAFNNRELWKTRLTKWNPGLLDSLKRSSDELKQTEDLISETAARITSRQVVDQFMDEQEEKSVELMEALRSHSSNVDNYIKRLSIAVEDDVTAQFYEPAFQRIRRVSRTWDVTLGQIETTTILTNNRTLAKVSPAASFEFDLPKRQILITEAMRGAKALADEYGNLLKDPTFAAGSELLRSRTAENISGTNGAYTRIPGTDNTPEFGSELEKLIEPPAIYKFETGTGFEIRPVIQPDGNSVMYAFDYNYSTSVREPVRADEKHLGRIKRHFVHTEVQTSSYELREISRYTVALKAARTDRGVPLFEDIPVLGYAFRPLPSDESALQTNIILGSSTIYPTVFDLMGLRWSPFVYGESQSTLQQEKVDVLSRRRDIRDKLMLKTRSDVNKRLNQFAN